jgi:hypothetical protein
MRRSDMFVGIFAQGFQGIARIGSLVQIPGAGSQIATALAVREFLFAPLFAMTLSIFPVLYLYIQG